MNKPSVSSVISASAKAGDRAKPKKAVAGKQISRDSKTTLNQEEVRQLIASTAYAYAEERGFVMGGEVEDWLRAERKISRMLSS
jgi:hypothetical protein